MKITKANSKANNITRRVRGVQKIAPAPKKAPAPKPAAVPKAPAPKPVAAPKPANVRTKKPTMDITRNNSGRVRIQRKVCDGQSRKMLDEMLVGFGMDPKSYKSKKTACDAIANAAQNMGMLGRYVTKSQEAKETKQFLKNLKAGKF